MITEITSVSAKYCSLIIKFYSKFGDKNYEWYEKKLKKKILSGRIIGKICIDKNNNEIIGAYLGIIQPLLSNSCLKAVQSIDSLVAPQFRGGRVFINLAKEFYDYLKKNSFDLVFGLPNTRIEKLRYKFLNWNFFSYTYSYNVFIPIIILKIIYVLISIFYDKDKLSFNFTDNNIIKLKQKIIINQNCIQIVKRKVYWVSSSNFFFNYIGLCRTGKKLNKFQKLYILSLIANHSKGVFLRTYSTEKTETASIFGPYSIKKRGLSFSGHKLKKNFPDNVNLNSLELVEFDNFGL